jgi:hypothetical protein
MWLDCVRKYGEGREGTEQVWFDHCCGAGGLRL